MIPALLAGFASMGVMVSVMNLTGYVVVDHRHHAQHLIFPIIGAHVLGMYALASSSSAPLSTGSAGRRRSRAASP